MSDLPSIYFNEYFRRKPERLSERECGSLFLMDKTEECDLEYVPHDRIKELEARLRESESYKTDWQEIAGKANLKALIKRLEDAEEVIEKLCDFNNSYDDICFLSIGEIRKHCENLRQIARSKYGSREYFERYKKEEK